jgi:hypothetical protein
MMIYDNELRRFRKALTIRVGLRCGASYRRLATCAAREPRRVHGAGEAAAYLVQYVIGRNRAVAQEPGGGLSGGS